MVKEKIIMDVDTGTDDAVALVMALLGEEYELLGISAVNGNVELRCTADNSQRVVECCGKEESVKVYAGADMPLVCTLDPQSAQARYPLPIRESYGEVDNMMHGFHLPLPEAKHPYEKRSSIFWMAETLLQAGEKEISLVPTGPLTNIALLLRTVPEVIPHIKRVVLMGGGHFIANASSAAEFNIWADPEAAEILLQSGLDITFVPLDATHQALISAEEAEEIAAIGTAPAKLVSAVIKERIARYSRRDRDMAEYGAAPVHDALALCALTHPEVLKDVRECDCHVDIGRGISYGRTVFDLRERVQPEAPNCRVALGADKDFFYQWILGILKLGKEC